MFGKWEKEDSIHLTQIPKAESLTDEETLALNYEKYMLGVIAAVRAGKSKNNISFKVPCEEVIVGTSKEGMIALDGFLPVLKAFTSCIKDVKMIKIEEMDLDAWNSPVEDLKVKLIFKVENLKKKN